MYSLIELTDGYKLDHRRQYSPGTEYVLSNLTARSVRDDRFKGCVFFGLQGFLQEFLIENAQATFFSRPLEEVIQEYYDLVKDYLGPDAAKAIGTDHIAELHKLGYIPLEFKALPEGAVVPIGVPMLTYENTDPRFFWVTNYFETLLSSVIWKACRNATIALEYRKIFDKYAKLTGGDPTFVQWQGHDFAFRGMGGPEDTARSNSGHLLSFTGSDSVPCIRWLKKYYDATGLIAGSVPATEHSVMCSGGQEDEYGTITRILDLYPTGPVSEVMDTWDLWKVIEEYLPRMKDKIMARDGKLVIRPDSGDPIKILCGDPSLGAHSKPSGRDRTVYDGVITSLWDIFQGTKTPKDYKVLDSHIGSIYGDSITLNRADEICERLANKGFASTNWVAGIGSYTYQYGTRDDFGMAVKATWIQNNGKDRLLQKDPVTGYGKKSAKGQLVVFETKSGYKLSDGYTKAEKQAWREYDKLKPVWRNGSFIVRRSLGEIRDRLSQYR